MTDAEYLKHYGVLGMKWGVRKSRRKAKREAKAATNRRHRVMDMTDDQIREVIARMKLEREYISLTTPEKSKGRQVVEEILMSSIKSTAKKATSKSMERVMLQMFPHLAPDEKEKKKEDKND